MQWARTIGAGMVSPTIIANFFKGPSNTNDGAILVTRSSTDPHHSQVSTGGGGYSKWWNLSDVASTLTVKSHQQYMPDTGQLECVIQINR